MTITEQARQLRTGGQAVDFRGPSLVVLEKMDLLGQVRTSVKRSRYLILRVPETWPWAQEFAAAVNRVRAIP